MTESQIDDIHDHLDETLCPHGIGLDEMCIICDADIEDDEDE